AGGADAGAGLEDEVVGGDLAAAADGAAGVQRQRQARVDAVVDGDAAGAGQQGGVGGEGNGAADAQCRGAVVAAEGVVAEGDVQRRQVAVGQRQLAGHVVEAAQLDVAVGAVGLDEQGAGAGDGFGVAQVDLVAGQGQGA